MKHERYDFGGGCRAVAYDENITIVDIMSINDDSNCYDNCEFKDVYTCKKDKYIVADIFSKNLKLPEKAIFINVSRVLRYFMDGGWITNEKLDHNKLQIAAKNINNNIINGGTVRLEDHMAVLEDVIEFLLEKNYEITHCELIEFRDEDYPAIWEITMKKLPKEKRKTNE